MITDVDKQMNMNLKPLLIKNQNKHHIVTFIMQNSATQFFGRGCNRLNRVMFEVVYYPFVFFSTVLFFLHLLHRCIIRITKVLCILWQYLLKMRTTLFVQSNLYICDLFEVIVHWIKLKPSISIAYESSYPF